MLLIEAWYKIRHRRNSCSRGSITCMCHRKSTGRVIRQTQLSACNSATPANNLISHRRCTSARLCGLKELRHPLRAAFNDTSPLLLTKVLIVNFLAARKPGTQQRTHEHIEISRQPPAKAREALSSRRGCLMTNETGSSESPLPRD